MNILLVVIAIIFLLSVFIGYKKGLVKIAASLAATLATVILVGILSPHVGAWIRKATPLEETVQQKVMEMLLPDTEDTESLLNVEMPREQQISLIENAEIPEMFRKMLLENNNNEVYDTLGVSTFGEYIGSYIAKIITDLIAFLITMTVVSIIIRVAISMLGILDKLPVIGKANKIGGAVVGIGIGLIVVWMFFILVTLLYNTAFGKTCFDNIAANPILTKLYDGNLLMKFITKL